MALEKFETIQQMGRFTLRDEGKTIAVGKVLKYKPYTKVIGASAIKEVTKQMEKAVITENKTEDLVFDMETGETRPKKKDMEAIQEGDEEERDWKYNFHN